MVFVIFKANAMDPKDISNMLHCLLFAGASGDKSSAAFASAVEKNTEPFIQLFIKHRIGLNWENGIITKKAVQAGKSYLLEQILRTCSLSEQQR